MMRTIRNDCLYDSVTTRCVRAFRLAYSSLPRLLLGRLLALCNYLGAHWAIFLRKYFDGAPECSNSHAHQSVRDVKLCGTYC